MESVTKLIKNTRGYKQNTETIIIIVSISSLYYFVTPIPFPPPIVNPVSCRINRLLVSQSYLYALGKGAVSYERVSMVKK